LWIVNTVLFFHFLQSKKLLQYASRCSELYPDENSGQAAHFHHCLAEESKSFIIVAVPIDVLPAKIKFVPHKVNRNISYSRYSMLHLTFFVPTLTSKFIIFSFYLYTLGYFKIIRQNHPAVHSHIP